MVMAPPVARTKPVTRTKPVARTAVIEPEPPATVAGAYPSPPAAAFPELASAVQAHPKHTRRRVAIGVAALLILLLLLGVCAVVAQATTLTVSPTRAARGETVRVTATHVPANQAGEVQLHSVVHTFPFQADSQGQVAIDMAVPEDVELGQHVVKICWNNTCHKDAMLRVVADAGEVLPSPSSGGSPGTSPSPGSSPSAGGSPRPSSTPTSSRTSPTPSSTATPTSPPTSTPKSSPTPPPTNPPPSITVTPTTVHILTSRKITVTGTYWPPGSTVTINYIQSGLVTTKIGNQNVQSDGSFSWTGNIPSSALPGSATIQVCSGSVCKSFGITVTT